MTRTATDTATRPCPTAHPAGLYLIKADALHHSLILMGLSLSLVSFSLLYAFPALAQSGCPGGSGYPGGGLGGSPADPGHRWDITYTQSGSWATLKLSTISATITDDGKVRQ